MHQHYHSIPRKQQSKLQLIRKDLNKHSEKCFSKDKNISRRFELKDNLEITMNKKKYMYKVNNKK